jgi:outer membrane protein TolC
MKWSLRAVALVAAAAGAARPVPRAHAEAAPAPERRAVTTMTLAQALDTALAHNPQLAIAAETIAAADAQATSDATLRLPVVNAKANMLVWNRALVADLGPDIGMVRIRDQVTGAVELSVAQPLSGALVIGKLVERDHAAAAASRAQRDGLRVDVAYQTAEVYLGALQAQTLAQVAAQTLQQLDADLQHARALLQAGALQRVDVLRLEVERARVEQQQLETQTAALSDRRRLALLLGLPDGSELALVEIDTTPPPLPFDEDEAVARARRDRADAKIASANRQVAELGVAVSRARYFPTVSLLGVYTHALNAGGSFATIPDSAYVGLSVDWNVWDWGKRGADVDAARAVSRQAELSQAAAVDQVAVEARVRWQVARTELASLEVAGRGEAAAAEAQRLLAARFAQGAATTVEVVDAETALANARSQVAIRRFQYLVAWMALSRGVGALPVPPGVR